MSRVGSRVGTKSRANTEERRQGKNGEKLLFGSWRGRPYGRTAKVNGTRRVGMAELRR